MKKITPTAAIPAPTTATDVGDIANLNASFSGTPTDLVEKAASSSTTGFSIAMAVALG